MQQPTTQNVPARIINQVSKETLKMYRGFTILPPNLRLIESHMLGENNFYILDMEIENFILSPLIICGYKRKSKN
jgi:hypothetical protein